LRIAIDFDNTLVSYGAIFARAANDLGLLADAPAGKSAVRDALRALPGGEGAWRRLQRHVYGPALANAAPFPGAREFVARARAAGAHPFVVSHKTPDLRGVAEAWLRANGFIAPAAFDPGDVFFEATREAKIARIAELGCTHAIDDLDEVFADPAFPPVERLLFAPEGAPAGPWRAFASWDDLARALFP
jgi:hypothetical protein